MSRTIKRGTARRAGAPRRNQAGGSVVDRLIAALPVSETVLRRVATWSIVGVTVGMVLVFVSWIGVPTAVGVAIAEGIGRAGFRVEQVEVTGLDRADRMAVYADALDQRSRAMPLIDLAAVRRKLLARQGWIADAHVSRRLPDTLLIEIVERRPTAVWQNQGRLALIADNGVLLEPVAPEAMPDLPLVIGPGANAQEPAYQRLMNAAPALRPLVKAATWIGNRRWNLTFVTGETLALPAGDADATAALVRFARLDAVRPLLGRGWMRFDMRDPTRLVARKPGLTDDRPTADPNAPQSTLTDLHPPAADQG